MGKNSIHLPSKASKGAAQVCEGRLEAFLCAQLLHRTLRSKTEPRMSDVTEKPNSGFRIGCVLGAFN